MCRPRVGWFGRDNESSVASLVQAVRQSAVRASLVGTSQGLIGSPDREVLSGHLVATYRDISGHSVGTIRPVAWSCV